MDDLRNKPDDYWRKKLTPEQYKVLREKGTEPAGSGKYFNNHQTGMYECAACGHPLFSGNSMFELDTSDPNYGWPSFDQPVNRENVELKDDDRYGMHRTEVICKNCGSHLGHLFNDGPKETTGEHYCINSCALNFNSHDQI